LILKVKKRGGIAPLRPPTLASFRTWGIQQELVVPPVTKVKQISGIAIPRQQNQPWNRRIKHEKFYLAGQLSLYQPLF